MKSVRTQVFLIDARMVGARGHGIARYVEEVAEDLHFGGPYQNLFKKSLGVPNWSEVRVIFLIRSDCPQDSPIRKFETIVLDLSCYSPVSWVLLPSLIRKLGADLFFNPTFASYPFLGCRFIQTIHDLNHLHFGSFLQQWYYRILLRWSCGQADHLLTVSRFIGDEIESWIPVAKGKLTVLYNSVVAPKKLDKSRVETLLAGIRLESGRFFFSVLNPKAHKNAKLLLEAYSEFRVTSGVSPYPLALTLEPSEIPLGLKDGVYSLGGVSPELLAALYQGAAGFFSPSLYEGFGRPPVEAALAGARVFASDIPPHREGAAVFGVKMEFLDPRDPLVWTRAFHEAGI